MGLTIKTDTGDFDLFDDETIVQTLGVFNFKDITSRSGEYSNLFNLPLTNNNRALINFADYINGVNTAPYKQIRISLIVDGLEFKTGYLSIEETSEVIKARFYTGNTNFYSVINQIKISQLDWAEYNHVWNLTNAVASSAATSGYFYPLIQYNKQTTSGDVVDIRYVLPSTYNHTILKKLFEFAGYTYVENYTTTEFKLSCLPYSKKNPVYSTEILLLNSLVGSNTSNYGFNKSKIIPYDPNNSSVQTFNFELFENTRVNVITAGTGTYWNNTNNIYTANITGVYDYSFVLAFLDYGVPSSGSSTYDFVYGSGFLISPFVFSINSFYQVVKVSGGIETVLVDTNISVSTSVSGNTVLNFGDELFIRYGQRGVILATVDTSINSPDVNFEFILFPTVLSTNTLTIQLQTEIVFGGTIPYNLMLPDIQGSNWLKDICIRFGLILSINEDTKVVTIDKLTKIYDNIPNAYNWTDKLDEVNKPVIKFAYDSYSQNNYFNHTFDKSVTTPPIGTDFNLIIDNQNLDLEKIIYTSPFAPSEQINFNGTSTLQINLVNTTTNKFSNEVKNRIAFSAGVVGIFKFTDGSTTSAYINVRRLWFIDDTLPDLTMGFGNLINHNSQVLIDILSNIKIVKADFNLNIVDISGFDYLKPVYVDQFKSYFFVTTINQYNYTSQQLTDVELIKLNL